MQQGMDAFAFASDNFGFTISTKKTEVMYQPTPGIPYQEPNITVMGQRLQTVENLAYLGSTLSRSANMDAEVNNRIAKATSAFWKMDEDSLGKKRYLAAKQNQSLQSSRLKSTSLRL